jgi:hypothetical protein
MFVLTGGTFVTEPAVVCIALVVEQMFGRMAELTVVSHGALSVYKKLTDGNVVDIPCV